MGVGQEPGGEFSLTEGEVPLADAPDVWSDGSLVLNGLFGIGVCWVWCLRPCIWYCFGLVGGGDTWICFLHCLMVLARLVDYCSIPGPLQTVQRAEIWGVLVALQGCVSMHVGEDNFNVVNHVSRIIAGRCASRPFFSG